MIFLKWVVPVPALTGVTAGGLVEHVPDGPSVAAGSADLGAVALVAGRRLHVAVLQGGLKVLLHARRVQVVLAPGDAGGERKDGQSNLHGAALLVGMGWGIGN